MLVTCFDAFESLFTSFSRSTFHWEETKKSVPITVKCECETRWSTFFEVVKSVNEGIVELVYLLERLADDRDSSTADTRSQAEIFLACILNVNFLTFLPFWFEILERANSVQKRLQDPKMNFHESSKDIEALRIEVSDKRETIPQDAIEVGNRNRTETATKKEDIRRRS